MPEIKIIRNESSSMVRKAEPATENERKLHSFMYSLLYPAVLGTMIVGVVLGITNDKLKIEYEFFYSIFLIFYFSTQHVENIRSEDSYKTSMFVLDFVEVCLIMWLFLLLNIYDYSGSVIKEGTNAWKCFYFSLIGAFLVPVVSRYLNMGSIFIRKHGRGQSIHSVIAIFITILCLLVEYSSMIEIEKKVILLFLLLALSLVYLSYLLFIVFKLKIDDILK